MYRKENIIMILTDLPDVLNSTEIQTVLDIGKEKLYKLIRSNEIKGFYRLGREWRINKDTLIAQLRSKENPRVSTD